MKAEIGVANGKEYIVSYLCSYRRGIVRDESHFHRQWPPKFDVEDCCSQRFNENR